MSEKEWRLHIRWLYATALDLADRAEKAALADDFVMAGVLLGASKAYRHAAKESEAEMKQGLH